MIDKAKTINDMYLSIFTKTCVHLFLAILCAAEIRQKRFDSLPQLYLYQ